MQSDIKNLEGLEIFLWYSCNVNCSFCFQEESRKENKDYIPDNSIYQLLDAWIENGRKFVIFSGWEPTLHPNLIQYIEYAKELGYTHIRIHTNGLRFRSYQYLEDLYKLGLTGVTISVHGFEGVHDAITKSRGSFDTIKKALINFQKLKQQDPTFIFDTNTVICRQNYRFLDTIIIFLSHFSIERVMLTYPYNTNTNNERLKSIIVKYDDLIAPLTQTLEIAHQRNFKNFVLESVPYCLIERKYWQFIEKNYRTKKDAFFVGGVIWSEDQYLNGKIKYKECNECLKYDQCYWFSHDYHILYESPHFKPINTYE